MTHEKYQQTWKGIKVEFGEFIVHKDKAENIVSVNGNFEEIPMPFNITPATDFSAAIRVFVYNYKISQYTVLSLPGKRADTPIANKSSRYELVIVRGYDNKLHLAYKTHLSTNERYGDYIAYIDCDSGKLIFKLPQIQDTNTPGTVQTTYSGTRNIIGDSFNGNFRLRENSRNGTTAILTLNYHRAPAANDNDIQNSIGNATDFIDNDNNWTAGEYNNAQHDQAALDAHWGSEMTIDYFETNHNRDSYDDNGGTVTNYVHVRTRDQYGNIVDMDNAFWNNTYHSMFYGDGLFFGPTVALDVCGHEIGHGVCYWSVGNQTGLLYQGESGALNESLSDMWGASVENWATTGKQTWLMGEDVIPSGLRSMSNPKGMGQPDTYGEDNWFNTSGCSPSSVNDYCGVHRNSGIGNYWFYLVSIGGSNTNDLGYMYNVSGIGIDKADNIIYRAETMYLNPTDDFVDARNATIAAASDLYGSTSCEVISVTNAWYAVGVGNGYNSNLVSTIEYGPNCNAIKVITTAPPTATLTWTTTQGMLINGNNSPQTITGNSATITSTNGNYAFVTVSDGCKSSTTDFCPCVDWPGNPQITWVWSSPAQGEPLEAYVSPAHPSADRYIWMVDGQVIQDGPETELQAYDYPCTSEKDLIVIAVDGCGATAPVSGGPYSPLCAAYRGTHDVVAYPNPASSQLTVKLKEPYVIKGKRISPSNTLSQIASIMIYDHAGRLRKTLRFTQGNKQVSYNVAGLPDQMYYLKVSDGQHAETISVLISR